MHFYLQIVHFLKWLGMGFIGEKVRATASVFLIGKSLVFKSLFLRLLERFFLVGWLGGWFSLLCNIFSPHAPKAGCGEVGDRAEPWTRLGGYPALSHRERGGAGLPLIMLCQDPSIWGISLAS